MRGSCQVRAHSGVDKQLFLELADKRVPRALTGLDLPSWKFPGVRHCLVGTAPCRENAAAANEYGSDDVDLVRHG